MQGFLAQFLLALRLAAKLEAYLLQKGIPWLSK
jgi:hypothetical protein